MGAILAHGLRLTFNMSMSLLSCPNFICNVVVTLLLLRMGVAIIRAFVGVELGAPKLLGSLFVSLTLQTFFSHCFTTFMSPMVPALAQSAPTLSQQGELLVGPDYTSIVADHVAKDTGSTIFTHVLKLVMLTVSSSAVVVCKRLF